MKRFVGWVFMGAEATVALCVLGWWIGSVSEAGRLRDQNAEMARTIEENALHLRDEARVKALLQKINHEAIPEALKTLLFEAALPNKKSDVGTYLREELEQMKSSLRKKAKKLRGLRHFPSNFGLDDLIKKEMSREEKEEFVRRLRATEYLLEAALVPGIAMVASVKQMKSEQLAVGNIVLQRYPVELSLEAPLEVIEQILGATTLKGRFLLLERLKVEPAAIEGNLKMTAVFSVLHRAKKTKPSRRRPTGRKPPRIFRRRRY